jgi:hypothetical protein
MTICFRGVVITCGNAGYERSVTLFDIQHADDDDCCWRDYSGSDGAPVINNAGKFRKSAGGGTVYIHPQFSNAGTVEELAGSIVFVE